MERMQSVHPPWQNPRYAPGCSVSDPDSLIPDPDQSRIQGFADQKLSCWIRIRIPYADQDAKSEENSCIKLLNVLF